MRSASRWEKHHSSPITTDYSLLTYLPGNQPCQTTFPFAPLEHALLIQEYLEIRERFAQFSSFEGELATDVSSQDFQLVHIERLEEQQTTGFQSASEGRKQGAEQEAGVDDEVERIGRQPEMLEVGVNRVDVESFGLGASIEALQSLPGDVDGDDRVAAACQV